MIDKVKFIEDINNLLSSGMSDKDVISYIKSLGFNEKETKEFMLEVKKSQNKGVDNLRKIIPTPPKEPMKKASPMKEEEKRELFKSNMEAVAKIMEKIKLGKIPPV